MKVTVRDSSVLKTVEPHILETYLRTAGWRETARILDDAAGVWRLKKDGFHEFEILLPLKPDWVDYAARISDALKTLESVENRSQIEILGELITKTNNIKIQGLVTHVEKHNQKMSGQVTLFGIVFDKLRKINVLLADDEYVLAIIAYQERLPILCLGDLVKVDKVFTLQNLQKFELDNIESF